MVLNAMDPHSYANTDQVQVTHMTLDLRLNFEAQTIAGTVTLDLDRRAPKLVLDTDQLIIQAVQDGAGNPLEYTLSPAKAYMGQALYVTLHDQTTQVTIQYTTSPSAGAIQWLSSEITQSHKPFVFTQSQATLARSWIPCMDSPSIKGTYRATIRVPAGLTAVMSAAHKDHDVERGVFTFQMDQPIPSYLIALAVGDLKFASLSDRTGVYAEPGVVDAAAAEFRDAEKMLKAAESLLGPYEWERWDILVLPASFPFGGMENPRITFATPTVIAGDRSLVSLLAHELAHSWSGNLVTNATWNDFWLNEGFTTYIENRIMEQLYGKDLAAMMGLLGQQDLQAAVKSLPAEDTKLKLDLKGRNADDGMSDVAYEKGANMLRLMEQAFGRDAFDIYLKGYFHRYKFKTLTTEDWLSDAKAQLQGNPNDIWERVENWVYQPGIPVDMVRLSSSRFKARTDDAKNWATSGTLPKTDEWVTQEWLHFLRSLPQQLAPEKLADLDRSFGLTHTGNAEIACTWFTLCIANNYTPSYDAVQTFLGTIGRRKFLMPLYEALLANPNTKELADAIYRKSRSNYHSISQASLDKLFSGPIQ
ncbi:MAG: M1 family metallopeptidase [Acidobacteria bacterium]|nr:M1 family metallopeptidase [Acidobacteriota bacterium]